MKGLMVSKHCVMTLLFHQQISGKLQAGQQGYFSLDEWWKGMKAMQVDSVDKLKKALLGLQQEVSSQYLFKDF
jgi:DCN1-like protein 4/5